MRGWADSPRQASLDHAAFLLSSVNAAVQQAHPCCHLARVLLALALPACWQTEVVGRTLGESTVILQPTADAYVEHDPPPATAAALLDNYRLKVRIPGALGERVAYLKFDLTEVPGDIVGASLELREAAGQSREGSWHALLGEHSHWTEEQRSVPSLPPASQWLAQLDGAFAAHALYRWELASEELSAEAHTIILQSLPEDQTSQDPAFFSSERDPDPTVDHQWLPPQLTVTFVK